MNNYYPLPTPIENKIPELISNEFINVQIDFEYVSDPQIGFDELKDDIIQDSVIIKLPVQMTFILNIKTKIYFGFLAYLKIKFPEMYFPEVTEIKIN